MPDLQYCPVFKSGLAFNPAAGLHPAAAGAMDALRGECDVETVVQLVLNGYGLAAAVQTRDALQLCAISNLLDYDVRFAGRYLARLCLLHPYVQPQRGRTGAALSRFALLRRAENRLIIESPLVGARVELDAGCVSPLGLFCSASPEDPLIRLLGETGFLESPNENEPPGEYWEFHDLLFHNASRHGPGRPVGATWRFQGRVAPPPAVKDPMSTLAQPLVRPEAPHDTAGFQGVLERRRSRRDPGPVPITLSQLGEFLHRAVGIRQRIAGDPQELLLRPYPSGGAIHELEFYVAVHQCDGLEPGFYHYHAGEHALYRLPAAEAQVKQMIAMALTSWGGAYPAPNLFLTIAARLPRLAWKYQSMAYRIVLLNAGAALQTMYLVATDMGLAPCAVGNGDPALFQAITGIDPMEETSVAEFALSSASAVELRSTL